MSAKLSALERRYQDILHEGELICNEEERRRLRLDALVLRNENAALQSQLAERDSRCAQMQRECRRHLSQLEESQQKAEHLQSQVRSLTNDLSILKVPSAGEISKSRRLVKAELTVSQEELNEMSSMNHESTKLLAEKLALSRQLAQLKPELEHAKSQLAHQQGILAEKLSLQRQVDALQVELATERRATQRALQKLAQREAPESPVKSPRKMEKKTPGAAKKETKAPPETADVTAAPNSRPNEPQKRARDDNTAHGVDPQKRARDDNTTQGVGPQKRARDGNTTQAAEAQGGSEESVSVDDDNAEGAAEQAEVDPPVKGKMPPSTMKKATEAGVATKQKPAARRGRRKDAEPEDAVGPQTPEADDKGRRDLKRKRALGHVQFGEKSTFSITPFLNRTKSIGDSMADETVMNVSQVTQDDDDGTESPRIRPKLLASGPKEQAKTAAVPPAKERQDRAAPVRVLGEVSPSKRNSRPLPTNEATKERKGAPTLKATPVLSSSDGNDNCAKPAKVSVVENSGKSSTTNKASQQQEHEPQKKQQQPQPSADDSVEGNSRLGNRSGEDSTTIGSGMGESEQQPKKKKRKILGGGVAKTIFDEDDDDAPKRPITKAPIRTIAGGGKLGKPAAMLGPPGLKRVVAGDVGAFGAGAAFSPLKRDRRGVGASFLT